MHENHVLEIEKKTDELYPIILVKLEGLAANVFPEDGKLSDSDKKLIEHFVERKVDRVLTFGI
jgi:hypothetical protein